MRILKTFCFALLVAAACVHMARPAHAQAAAETAALESLQIASGAGAKLSFQVEVMRTDAERAKGLMFRRFLPADRGMLFDFKTEQPVMMWMKNTYLPLDMIFIARNGLVLRF